jgi:ABC-2 type transport system ATP-binding protein
MVTVEALAFGYKRKRRLFSDLQLHLEPGGIYGLLGKNGAGKTTLLKLLCGLRFPQSGTCRVLGLDPARRPVGLLEEVFLLAEEMPVPPLSGTAYVDLYAPFYPRFEREAFTAHLGELEIDPAERLSEMSHGQKKKFMVAFGLSTGCRLLLLDEPTNGLDIPSKSQFRRLLSRSVRDDRVIVISTHQVRDMEYLIDPVVILDRGQVVFNQPIARIAQRLSVRHETAEPHDDDVLYAEKSMAGYQVVRRLMSNNETGVDLETLFNAVTNAGDRVRSLFVTGHAGKEI